MSGGGDDIHTSGYDGSQLLLLSFWAYVWLVENERTVAAVNNIIVVIKTVATILAFILAIESYGMIKGGIAFMGCL